MRISDWSSDVCSSDLGREIEEGQERLAVLYQAFGGLGILDPVFLDEDLDGGFRRRPVRCVEHLAQIVLDRKSVVSGKSVSVRVDIGGRRIIKNKKPALLATQQTWTK